jgi:ankyrin repeat protein
MTFFAVQAITKVITSCTGLCACGIHPPPTSGVQAQPMLLEVIIHATDKHRRMALHHAAAAGNVKAVQAICKVLQVQSLPIDKPDHCGWTPLHLASAFGHADCVDILLKASADPSRVDALGWMPLHYAAKVCTHMHMHKIVGMPSMHPGSC